MWTRQRSTALHRRRIKFPQGDLRMNLLLWCMLILFLCSSTKEMPMGEARPLKYLSRWHLYQMEKGQNIIRNFKRHSDGTFTSDLTSSLDKMKAKDFVEWLTSIKREGCCEEVLHIAAGV